jgi:NADPH:quinone reductase-like Zn-dependent oxidoreductase
MKVFVHHRLLLGTDRFKSLAHSARQGHELICSARVTAHLQKQPIIEARNLEKVLVTGGAGFIGSHLVDALKAQRANVFVFDNLTSGTPDNIKRWRKDTNFSFIKGDLSTA